MVKRRISGIGSYIGLTLLYIIASEAACECLSDTQWYFYDSGVRIVFGVNSVLVIMKLYGETFKDVLDFLEFRKAFF